MLRRAWYGCNRTYDAMATGVHDVSLYLATVLAHLAADGCQESNRLEGLPQEAVKPAVARRIEELKRRSALLWGEARAVCDEGLGVRLVSLPVQFGDWDQETARIMAGRALLEPAEAERHRFAAHAEALNKEHRTKIQAMIDLARSPVNRKKTPLATMPCGVGLGYLAFAPPVYSSRPLR